MFGYLIFAFAFHLNSAVPVNIHTLGELLRDKSCGRRKDAEEGGDNGLHGSNLFSLSTQYAIAKRTGGVERCQVRSLGIACPSFSLLRNLVDIVGTAAIFRRQMSTSGSDRWEQMVLILLILPALPTMVCFGFARRFPRRTTGRHGC